MSKRPAITMMLVSPQRWVRADFANYTGVPEINSLFAETSSDWLTAVRSLSVIAPLGRRVRIFCSMTGQHLISFSSASLAQMDDDEIDNAIRFEVETLSGIEIDDIATGRVPAESLQNDEKRFWVTVVRKSEFQTLTKLFQDHAVRDFDFQHPSGQIAWPQPDEPRRELWGSSVFEFDSKSGLLKSFQRIAQLPDSASPLSIQLGLPNDDQVDSRIRLGMDLSDELSLGHWFRQVLESSSQRDSLAPVLQKARRTSAIDWRPVLATLMACAAVIGCVLHRNLTLEQTSDVIARTEQLAEPGISKKRDDSENLKLIEQLKELEAESLTIANELKRVQFFSMSQMQRLPTLLRMISELRADELVMQSISMDPKGLLIAGVSLNGEAAPNLANRLRLLALPMGWKVSGATQEGQQKLISGGPWTFQILLEDVGPFDSPPSTSTVSPNASRNKF
ncbi:MAG: hypothetical protein R3C03_07180 [Pirellulaceae bacterium]